jgi:mono/diheme cytochrome c family protein
LIHIKTAALVIFYSVPAELWFQGLCSMLRVYWIRIVLVIIFALIVLFFVRMHVAAGQAQPPAAADRTRIERLAKGSAQSGRLYAQNWCTECHSVEAETAGTGQFAPDFTVIAQRRSARWLNAFLRASHKLMPNFVLKDAEADDIVAYILTLKRG